MKVVKIIILLFYLVLVIPTVAILMGGLIYGGVVETVKAMKKP